MARTDSLGEYELELYQSWRKTKNPEYLTKLMNSLKPVMFKEIGKWRGGALPDEVLHAQGMKLLYKGIQTYDPKKGVKLSTHITNQLKPLSRLVYTYSNVLRIPENRVQRIALFRRALDELQDKLGRRPSVDELADHLSWSKRLVAETWQAILKDTLIQEGYMHMPVTETTPMSWAIDFFYQSLSPKEKILFEDLVGYGGRPQLPEKQILKEHKITPEKLAKFKEKIKNELPQLVAVKHRLFELE